MKKELKKEMKSNAKLIEKLVVLKGQIQGGETAIPLDPDEKRQMILSVNKLLVLLKHCNLRLESGIDDLENEHE